jgi:alpha-ribazole phosphatase
MEIFLIRHTTPVVPANTCYGQADVDLVTDYMKEAVQVKNKIEGHVAKVWCSPLRRCSKLAQFIFPDNHVVFDDDLKEINCGSWELKPLDDIPKAELRYWMAHYKTVPYPGGESYIALQQRVMRGFQRISTEGYERVAIVTHAGVIRCILACVLDLTVEDVFDKYRLPYGAVIEIKKEKDKWVCK